MLSVDPDVEMYPPRRWGALVALGALLALLGVWLLLSPFDAAGTLALLVALALLLQAIDTLSSARWMPSPVLGYLIGAVYLVTALVAIAWPGITLWAVAVVVGIGFIVAGAAEVAARRAVAPGPGRVLLVAAGLLTILAGIVAITWPGATILVLAVLLGIKVLASGLSLVGAGLDLRRLLQDQG